jgi:DNA-binding beta-propeller fold protein YncE
MTELEETLRRYIADRAGRVTQSEADMVAARAASARAARRGSARHLFNAGAAVTLVLVLIATGIVVQMQLRGQRSSGPATTGSGHLPSVPNEVIDLDDFSQGPDMTVPFQLKDARRLAPRPRWALPGNRALLLASSSDCSTTTVDVVDRTTRKDTQPPVTLTDCYDTPVILPGAAVLLAHHNYKNGNMRDYQDLGAVRYDWSLGQITQSYSFLSFSFVGGLPSSDGQVLYTLNPFASKPALDFTDLRSGVRNVHIPITLADAGGGTSAGGLALSPDGRMLYVNLGDRLATFDAKIGTAGPVLLFTGGQKSSISALPWWLPSVISADAKEGFEPGHGIAVDPRGRWVVALGGYYDTAGLEDLWLFSTSGSSIQLVRRIDAGSGFQGVAFSRDGSVLYALDQGYLDLIDPQTGREIKHLGVGGVGIAGVEAR